MNEEGVLINTAHAYQDAIDIENIISAISDDLDSLDKNLKKYISSEDQKVNLEVIQTDWGVNIIKNWEQFYNNDIVESLYNMKQSATNVRLAAERMAEYQDGSN